MIDRDERRQILCRPKPDPPWMGEPLLGSIYGEEEIEAAVTAIRESMSPNVGFGFSASPIPDFERAFADYVGAQHAVAINSAGPGLDMIMRLLQLEPGDEVIVPAINFAAAPLAVIGAGGQVIWAEVDERTLQLDPEDVERRMTACTRAILATHMNGLSSPMDDLLEIARRHPHPRHGPPAVFGDAARACGGSYRGTQVGKKGLANVFSFHTMKNITTLGEGGMITTDDHEVERVCRAARMYGGPSGPDEVWGTSNVMTKVQAAVGLVQLGRLDELVATRRRLAHQRNRLLADVPEIQIPEEPPDCVHTYYLYTCLVCEEWAGHNRDQIQGMMHDDFGVGCVIANPPVYQERHMIRAHTQGQSLPRSDRIGERLFCVALHPSMTEAENEYIAAALIECVERLRGSP